MFPTSSHRRYASTSRDVALTPLTGTRRPRTVHAGACGRSHRLPRRARRRPAHPPATSPTTAWRPRRSSPCRCTVRCSARASPAPARPRSRRRSPTVLDAELIRLQCYEGIDASQALYDWDFPRQLLHLRALEAAGGRRRRRRDDVEASLYDRRFLLARPILRALQTPPRRAARRRGRPRRRRVRGVPARGAHRARRVDPRARRGARRDVPPVVVLTSNRTREVHDALKRRCLYLWLDHPDLAREIEILHAPDARAPRAAGRRRSPPPSTGLRAARPAQAARRRRVARLGARPAARRRAPPRHRQRGGDARAPSSSTARTPTACGPGSTPCCAS